MATKSKGKFIDFLRLLYAFLSAVGKRLGVILRHARERVGYWYDSQEVKPQDKALAFIKKLVTLSWYREMDEKARARFRHLLLRSLVFLLMLAGVFSIAQSTIDFKDILAYIINWEGAPETEKTKEELKTHQYFLGRVSYDQWKDYEDKDPRKPEFALAFPSDLAEVLTVENNEIKKNTEIEKKLDVLKFIETYQKQFVDNNYRFFMCDSKNSDGKVLYSNWDYFKDDYIKILMLKSEDEFNKTIEKYKPEYVSDISKHYNNRYIIQIDTPIVLNGEKFFLFLAISEFHVIEKNVGARALALAVIGVLLALASVLTNSFVSAQYKISEGKLKMFNRTSLTLLLAAYLLAGFAVLTAIFFNWFISSNSYINNDIERQKLITYCLSAVYALLTFLITSAIGNGLAVAHQNAVLLKKMKAELVANVSHDIKTPLTSIIGYVSLLEQDTSLSAEARSYVGILKAKSERLKSIVSDLFELSKSTAGNGDIKLEKLDLKKLIEQTLADMEDDIEASGRSIRSTLPNRAVYIRGDGAKLFRVLQNIIGNALKYSVEDVPIRLSCQVVAKKAIVEIGNTASYKMDFTAEEVLSRYARGKGTMAEDGIGLGLSIADTFVRECGGELRIRIEEDQFRVFIIFRTLQ